jgi:hypothetical protein
VEGSFQVGAWRVEPQLNKISSSSLEVRLEPRAMELLVYLAEHHTSRKKPRSTTAASSSSGKIAIRRFSPGSMRRGSDSIV